MAAAVFSNWRWLAVDGRESFRLPAVDGREPSGIVVPISGAYSMNPQKCSVRRFMLDDGGGGGGGGGTECQVLSSLNIAPLRIGTEAQRRLKITCVSRFRSGYTVTIHHLRYMCQDTYPIYKVPTQSLTKSDNRNKQSTNPPFPRAPAQVRR